MKNAYKLLIAYFPQSSTGTALPGLVDAAYGDVKWGASSLIPAGIDLTNYNDSGITTSTEDLKSITDLSLSPRKRSTTVVDGDVSCATVQSPEIASITASLEASGGEDPLLGLLVVGQYKGDTTAGRQFDVIYSAAAYLTQEAGVSGEAHENFKATLKWTPSGRARRGIDIGYTATVSSSTGDITIAQTSTL